MWATVCTIKWKLKHLLVVKRHHTVNKPHLKPVQQSWSLLMLAWIFLYSCNTNSGLQFIISWVDLWPTCCSPPSTSVVMMMFCDSPSWPISVDWPWSIAFWMTTSAELFPWIRIFFWSSFWTVAVEITEFAEEGWVRTSPDTYNYRYEHQLLIVLSLKLAQNQYLLRHQFTVVSHIWFGKMAGVYLGIVINWNFWTIFLI